MLRKSKRQKDILELPVNPCFRPLGRGDPVPDNMGLRDKMLTRKQQERPGGVQNAKDNGRVKEGISKDRKQKPSESVR